MSTVLTAVLTAICQPQRFAPIVLTLFSHGENSEKPMNTGILPYLYSQCSRSMRSPPYFSFSLTPFRE
jgi:hypothetical protein